MERQGYTARRAALSTYTQGQANRSTSQGPSDNEENPGPDQPSHTRHASPDHQDPSPPPGSPNGSSSATNSIKSVLSALQHVNQVEGERFERLLGVLIDEHQSVAKLAESTHALARAQAESNHLLRVMISNSGVVVPPFEPDPSESTPGPA